MRAPVSGLRSLALLRAGMVARPAPGRITASRRGRAGATLLLLALPAVLTACDGAGITSPEPTGGDAPGLRGREAATRPA